MQRVFAALLFLAPAEFRQRYGRQLLLDFSASLQDAQSEGRSRALFALTACGDLLSTIARERTSNTVRTLTYTLRSLIRTPGVTLAMILTLAIGIGANVAAFSIINGVLLNPLPFPHADRIMAVWRVTWINGEECRGCPHSLFSAFEYRSRNTTFSSLAPYQQFNAIVSGPSGPAQYVHGARVGAQFSDVIQERPALGRAFTLADERYGAPPVALLSYQYWSDRFHADPAITGKSVLLDGRAYRIIGVLPKDFFFPNFSRLIAEHPAVLVVAQRAPNLQPGNNNMGIIGRLKDGVTPAQATADLDRVIADLNRTHPGHYVQGGHLEGVNVRPLAEDLFGPARALLFPIFGAVFIVLLIACLNVANLLIARTIGRQRDLAMRLAIGATRRHVIAQIATEALALCVAGAIVGVIAAHYALRAYLAMNPPGIHRIDHIGIDARVVLYAAGVAILSALITSVFPALISLRGQAFASLKDGRSQTGDRGRAARAVLVVVQISCAFALVVSCGLLVRSLAAYAAADLGYSTSSLLTINGPPLSAGFYPNSATQTAYLQRLTANLSSIPGVDGVAYGTAVPLVGGGSDGTFSMNGAPKDADADFEFVSPGYFEALRIPLLRGRDIAVTDTAKSRPVAVVDREFVKRFVRGGQAIGKHFHYSGVDFVIVGVTPSVMLHYAGEQPYPSMYFALAQLYTIWQTDLSGFYVPFAVHTPVPPASLTSAIVAAWRSADVREPLPDLATVPQLVAVQTANTRANAFVLGALALIALLLAISGTASVAAYAIARRTNEIGVRTALGARRLRVVQGLLGGAVAMLVAGLIVGLGLAALASNSLTPQLYKTPPFDPQTYIAVAFILAAATLLASFIPAYRAAGVDPSTALRYE